MLFVKWDETNRLLQVQFLFICSVFGLSFAREYTLDSLYNATIDQFMLGEEKMSST